MDEALATLGSSNASGLPIDNPLEFLYAFDDDFGSGFYKPYNWQSRLMLEFGESSSAEAPYYGALRAANGSGKDRMVIAPCAGWLGTRFPDTSIVITSASGQQLDHQTGNYLNRMLSSVNKAFGQEVWKLNYRHYANLHNGSEINMFATNEAGRAEGWHPLRPQGQFAIFTSETKSIPEEITTALHRCTGFTKRLDCSTPGLPQGYFFDICSDPAIRQYHITAYDCPHLGEQYIERTRRLYGEGHFLFRSMILAEFGTTDEMVVVPYTMIYRLLKSLPEWHKDPFNTAGVDLSAGGDEQVLVVRCGNKLVGIRVYHFEDTSLLIEQLIRDFKEFGLDNKHSLIYADAGGLGKPIIDQLVSRGWTNIRYVLNGAAARNDKAYGNFGTELYFNLRDLVEKQFIDITIGDSGADEKLVRQLSSRFYTITTTFSKVQLESKAQAKAKGHPSPDRADALSLCFCDYRSPMRGSSELVKLRVLEGLEATEPRHAVPYYKLDTIARDDTQFPKFAKTVCPADLAYLVQDLREELQRYAKVNQS